MDIDELPEVRPEYPVLFMRHAVTQLFDPETITRLVFDWNKKKRVWISQCKKYFAFEIVKDGEPKFIVQDYRYIPDY